MSIGRAGHFNTNPESLSPRYGQWIASWAFRCWREMIGRGELTDTEPFPIIEFGAGNGRLARDIVDAIAAAAEAATRTTGGTFAARLQYRIYETSASLRDKQRALLGIGRRRRGRGRAPSGRDAGARLSRRPQGLRADQ